MEQISSEVSKKAILVGRVSKVKDNPYRMVGLYLPRPVLSHGQFYVAISQSLVKIA